jgi:hypothetical protein
VPGIYHFRFLKTLGDMKVWMDIVDDHAAVPLADGSVFAKVSRVTAPVVKSSHSVEQSEHSNGQDSKQSAQLLFNDSNSPNTAAAPSSKVTSPSIAAPPKNTSNLLNFNDDVDPSGNAASPPAKSAAPAASAAATGSGDLIGFDMPVASKVRLHNSPHFLYSTIFSYLVVLQCGPIRSGNTPTDKFGSVWLFQRNACNETTTSKSNRTHGGNKTDGCQQQPGRSDGWWIWRLRHGQHGWIIRRLQ